MDGIVFDLMLVIVGETFTDSFENMFGLYFLEVGRSAFPAGLLISQVFLQTLIDPLLHYDIVVLILDDKQFGRNFQEDNLLEDARRQLFGSAIELVDLILIVFHCIMD